MGINEIHKETIKLFSDWDDTDISIRRVNGGRAAAVGIGLDLIGTSASTGGNAASALLNKFLNHNRLSIARYSDDKRPPTWQYLLAGNEVLVTGCQSWTWMDSDSDLPDVMTVAEISAITGLSKDTVREQLRLWVKAGLLAPTDEFGPHGTRSYKRDAVSNLAAKMRKYARSSMGR